MGVKVVGLTGANGFIGQHLTKHLTRQKYVVIPFKGDLLDLSAVERYVKRNRKMDALIHLAGLITGPDQTLFAVNTLSTQTVVSLLTKYQVPKIIFSSTGAIYGEADHGRFKESDRPRPNTVYGLSKFLAEEVIVYHARLKGLRYVILRFPNVYGPGNNKGVIYNFLHDIKTKKAITIYGDGQQKRQFLHVSDAVRALAKSLRASSFGTFNIAPVQSYSLKKVVRELKRQYHFSVKYQPAEDKVKNMLLDSNLSRRQFKFKPRIERVSYEL